MHDLFLKDYLGVLASHPKVKPAVKYLLISDANIFLLQKLSSSTTSFNNKVCMEADVWSPVIL